MPKTVLLPYYLKWSITGRPPFSQTSDATAPAGTPTRWTGDASQLVVSNVIDARYLDNIAIQVSFLGAPTGTLVFQGSNDFFPNPNAISEGTPINNGTWTSLTPGPTSPTGSPITVLGNLVGVAFAFLRVQYTPTSGSGTILGMASGSSL